MMTEFAELVGLICHFRQEKGSREALDHQKFIEWLEYHRHEELKNLIVNTAALRTEVDGLLRSDHAEMMKKLDQIRELLQCLPRSLHNLAESVAKAVAQRDRETRKHAFRAAIRSIRSRLQETPADGLLEAQQASVARIVDESAIIGEDIPAEKRARFRITWEAYIRLAPAQVQNTDCPPIPPELLHRSVIRPPERYELGRKHIAGLLDTLIDCAQ